MRDDRSGRRSVLDVGGFTDVDARDAGAYIRYLDAGAGGRQPGKAASYVAQGIGPGMAVLDLGCGLGDDVRALAALVGPAGRVAGVDSSRAMVAEAIRRGVPSNAEVVAASAYALPFAETTFDACRAERVLQHLERPDDAVDELRRVLKPGGSLIVIDHDWESLAVSGGDPVLTRRIVSAFAESFASGSVGRDNAAIMRRARFRDVDASGGVTSLPFEPARTFVLLPAMAFAAARGDITSEEADAWIASLDAAERRGEFAYAVSAFAVIGRR